MVDEDRKSPLRPSLPFVLRVPSIRPLLSQNPRPERVWFDGRKRAGRGHLHTPLYNQLPVFRRGREAGLDSHSEGLVGEWRDRREEEAGLAPFVESSWLHPLCNRERL